MEKLRLLCFLTLTFSLTKSARTDDNWTKDAFYSSQFRLPKNLQSASPRCQIELDAWCKNEAHYHCSKPNYARATYKNDSVWGCTTDRDNAFCPSHGPLAQLLNSCESNLTIVDVFVSGDAGINTYRIPAIIQTSSGDLLAFAEGRIASSSDCMRKILVMKRSNDSGRSWQDLQKLPIGLNDSHLVVGNPQPVFDFATNTTLIAYVTNEDTARTCDPGQDNWILTSSDEGESWNMPPRNISSVLGRYAGLLPGPGGATQMTMAPYAGRLVFAGHYGAYEKDLVWFTDDHGAKFVASSTPLAYVDEAQIVELTNGSLLLNMRTRHLNATCKCRATSVSDNGGETWSPIRFDPTLISPVCEASIVRIGSRIYFANPASTTSRENLTIRVSGDDCETWTKATLVVSPGPLGGGYSDFVSFPMRDDATKGGILFERPHSIHGTVRNVVSFARFPLDF